MPHRQHSIAETRVDLVGPITVRTKRARDPARNVQDRNSDSQVFCGWSAVLTWLTLGSSRSCTTVSYQGRWTSKHSPRSISGGYRKQWLLAHISIAMALIHANCRDLGVKEDYRKAFGDAGVVAPLVGLLEGAMEQSTQVATESLTVLAQTPANRALIRCALVDVPTQRAACLTNSIYPVAALHGRPWQCFRRFPTSSCWEHDDHACQMVHVGAMVGFERPNLHSTAVDLGQKLHLALSLWPTSSPCP